MLLKANKIKKYLFLNPITLKLVKIKPKTIFYKVFSRFCLKITLFIKLPYFFKLWKMPQ